MPQLNLLKTTALMNSAIVRDWGIFAIFRLRHQDANWL